MGRRNRVWGHWCRSTADDGKPYLGVSTSIALLCPGAVLAVAWPRFHRHSRARTNVCIVCHLEQARESSNRYLAGASGGAVSGLHTIGDVADQACLFVLGSTRKWIHFFCGLWHFDLLRPFRAKRRMTGLGKYQAHQVPTIWTKARGSRL